MTKYSYMASLYVFGWPSHLGGADTRLVHTLKIWSKFMDVTVIPNGNISKNEWTTYLDSLGCKYKTIGELPTKLDGIAISMCNDHFFNRKIAHMAKNAGLRVIWSSEMMWHHKGELDAVKSGVVDTVLYTSDFQKNTLKPNYDNCGICLKEYVVDNFIDFHDFPLVERPNSTSHLNIGRISRPTADKYPENFPLFYKHLGLNHPHFTVMAWSNALREKYSWFDFDHNWTLLEPNAITVNQLLAQIDIFVYPLGHTFKESWGRSTAEAMLTGCPVVVPYGHHFVNFVKQGVTGFMYKTYEDCRNICKALEANPLWRKRIGLAGRNELIEKTFNVNVHTDKWKEVFNV